MIEQVVFSSEAEDDIADAFYWYESRDAGLGEDFLRCVEACLLTIQRHPQIYPIAEDEFRHALIRRFPFEIFYEAKEDTIRVYSVFHCSQDPEKWRKRLGFDS